MPDTSLSPIQRAYLVGNQDGLELRGPARYHIACDLRPDRVPGLGDRLRTLVRRHAVLRTSVGADLSLTVLPADDFLSEVDVGVHEVGEGGFAAADAAVRAAFTSDTFAFAGRPRFQVAAVRAPGRARLHLVYDLWLMDAASLEVFLADLIAAPARPPAHLPLAAGYAAGPAPVSAAVSAPESAAGPAATPAPAPVSAAAPAATSAAPVFSAAPADAPAPARDSANAPAPVRDRSARDRRFWRRHAAALAGPAELPLRPDWRRAGPAVAHRLVTLDAVTAERFAKAARGHGLTPAMAYLTVYGLCLGRAAGGGPHTLTVLRSLRGPDPRWQGFGNHGSTMPLEIPAVAGQSFADLAREVQRRYLSQAAHGSLGGAEIVRLAGAGEDPRRLPYPYAFTALDTDSRAERDLGFTRRWEQAQLRVPQVLIDHQVISDADGGVRLGFDWRRDAFDPGFAEDLVTGYAGLVRNLAHSDAAEGWDRPPQRTVATERLPAPGAPAGDTLHGRVLSAAGAYPDAPAVHDADGTLSYRALVGHAAALADRLAVAGARPGDRVAVHLPCGRGQVIAVLGALLAGCVYVPLDRGTPDGRLDSIARRGALGFAVTGGSGETARWERRGVRALELPGAPDGQGAAEALTRPVGAAPGGTAYIVFTSGSTGEPKGVMISHSAALTTIDAVNDLLGMGSSDRVLSVSSFGFDLSVYDMFGPLLRGGAVVMLSERTVRAPGAWARLIDRHEVTVWNSAPALASLLAAEDAALPTLRAFLLSGDWIPLPLPDELRRLSPAAEVISLGGATEGAIWSVFHRVGPADRHGRSIPYGTALPGQHVLVLDPERRVCPDWHIGEIHLAGAGVADGYAGDPQRTRAAFFDDPEYGRTYRTGDRGRRHPGGVVEFLGRTDSQVKINGHRVELGEIEHVLESVAGIARCAATVRGEGTRRRVVAYVRLDAGAPDTWRQAARQAAARALPRYMLPDAVVELAEIPLTGNGKVDRERLRSLPLPAREPAASAAPTALGLREQEVARCWQEVLGHSAGAGTFFDDGGTSFDAIRLLSLLRGTYGHEVAFGDFMAGPTVRALAARCAEGAAGGRGAIWTYAPRTPPRPRLRVVLFPPVGGGVSCYAGLTLSLRPDAEVHVVGIDAPTRGTASLGDLAGRCLRRLPGDVLGSPEPPLVFAGWSFGGALAYEAAGLAPVPVARVVVVDTPVSAPARAGAASEDAGAFVRDIRRAGGVAVTAAQVTAEPALRDRFEVYRQNLRLLRSWQPPRLTVPVVELRARTDPAEQRPGAWRQAAALVRTEPLTGGHYDVFEEDNVQRIAHAVEEVCRDGLG